MTLALQQLQQQLMAAITGFTGMPPAMQAALQPATQLPPHRPVHEQLSAAAHLSPAESLAIYQHGYRARLLDCLRTEFPVLRMFWGHELFDRFAMEYLGQTASHAYSLFQLGAAFPGRLAASCPDLTGLDPAMQAHCRLPIELAQLERLRVQAVRGVGPENTPLWEPDYQNQEALGQLRPRTPATLGLMLAGHDLPEFYQALRAAGGAGQTLPQAALKHSFIAIGRNHYRLTLHSISPWQYSLLAKLAKPDATQAPTLAELLVAVAEQQKMPLPELQARLPFWLPLAVARGYLMLPQPGAADATRPV